MPSDYIKVSVVFTVFAVATVMFIVFSVNDIRKKLRSESELNNRIKKAERYSRGFVDRVVSDSNIQLNHYEDVIRGLEDTVETLKGELSVERSINNLEN
jgi:hypothetical protein